MNEEQSEELISVLKEIKNSIIKIYENKKTLEHQQDKTFICRVLDKDNTFYNSLNEQQKELLNYLKTEPIIFRHKQIHILNKQVEKWILK